MQTHALVACALHLVVPGLPNAPPAAPALVLIIIARTPLASPPTSHAQDDIHLGPGWAVNQEQVAGRVQVLEKYGPFRPDTLENPCSECAAIQRRNARRSTERP